MPQMSPVSWYSLMATMLLTMMMMNSILYFKPSKKLFMKNKENLKKMNWKW